MSAWKINILALHLLFSYGKTSIQVVLLQPSARATKADQSSRYFPRFWCSGTVPAG